MMFNKYYDRTAEAKKKSEWAMIHDSLQIDKRKKVKWSNGYKIKSWKFSKRRLDQYEIKSSKGNALKSLIDIPTRCFIWYDTFSRKNRVAQTHTLPTNVLKLFYKLK